VSIYDHDAYIDERRVVGRLFWYWSDSVPLADGTYGFARSAEFGYCLIVRIIDVLVLEGLDDNGESTTANGVLAMRKTFVPRLLSSARHKIGPWNQRHHGNQRSDSHGQAEHGQGRAELVRSDGITASRRLSRMSTMLMHSIPSTMECLAA